MSTFNNELEKLQTALLELQDVLPGGSESRIITRATSKIPRLEIKVETHGYMMQFDIYIQGGTMYAVGYTYNQPVINYGTTGWRTLRAENQIGNIEQVSRFISARLVAELGIAYLTELG